MVRMSPQPMQSTTCRRKGFKFELLHHVAQEHRSTLAKYDRIWCPDDDIACCTSDLNLLFDIVQRHGLQLAQPAVADGDVSYRYLLRKRGNILRYTPFVEVMCPCSPAMRFSN